MIQCICLPFISASVQLDCIICWCKGVSERVMGCCTAGPYEEDVVNTSLIQLGWLAKSGIFHYRSLNLKPYHNDYCIDYREGSSHGSSNMQTVTCKCHTQAPRILHNCSWEQISPAWGVSPSESGWSWCGYPQTMARLPFLEKKCRHLEIALWRMQ